MDNRTLTVYVAHETRTLNARGTLTVTYEFHPGKMPHGYWTQFKKTLEEAGFRVEAEDAEPIGTIEATGAPPQVGRCSARPALDGSQGNPMRFCAFDAGHDGPHSWAANV